MQNFTEQTPGNILQMPTPVNGQTDSRDTGDKAVIERNANAGRPSQAEFIKVIGPEQLQTFNEALRRYKSGKAKLDRRVKDAERWWNQRNEFIEDTVFDGGDSDTGFRTKTAWLLNVVMSKHADYIEAYPAPNINAHEEHDKAEARMLSSIIPVILKKNHFMTTYDQAGWSKLKFGTGVYKVIYDRTKMHGLGDISIVKRSILNVFWEPGITDIQQSKYFFDVEMADRDTLLDEYPQLEEKNIGGNFQPEKMPTDDKDPNENKVAVIEVYYKRRGKLHYVKYVGDTVIYASEDDHEIISKDRSNLTGLLENVHSRATDGIYAHGLYPYVFDALFPVEESPAGRGYIDIGANAQERIDTLTDSGTIRTKFNAAPKVLTRSDGQLNEEELMNLKKVLVHYTGSLDPNQFMQLQTSPLDGNDINFLNNTIQELKETTGNVDAGNGVASNGVTAASALAALQQASGKLSRASTLSTYTAFEQMIYMVIELIRQFYDLPRQFRITGEMGNDVYVNFSNEGMQPQWQGMVGDVDMGYRVPEYDIEVVPERESSYTKIAQNELAMELYGKGFFNPELTNQTLVALDMMDFNGKDELMRKISANGTMLQELRQWQKIALQLASRYAPELVQGLAQSVTGQPMNAAGNEEDGSGVRAAMEAAGQKENKLVEKARARADSAAQPGGAQA